MANEWNFPPTSKNVFDSRRWWKKHNLRLKKQFERKGWSYQNFGSREEEKKKNTETCAWCFYQEKKNAHKRTWHRLVQHPHMTSITFLSPKRKKEEETLFLSLHEPSLRNEFAFFSLSLSCSRCARLSLSLSRWNFIAKVKWRWIAKVANEIEHRNEIHPLRFFGLHSNLMWCSFYISY